MILETTRLRLIPFVKEDLRLLHETFTHPFVRKFLWDDQIILQEQVKTILEENDRNFQSSHWGLWKIVLRDDNSFAGFVGLWRFEEEQQPQLIFGLLPKKIKNGYATEASMQIILYAFNNLGFEEVVATCDLLNVDSRSVCERLGMIYIGDEKNNGRLLARYRIQKVSRAVH